MASFSGSEHDSIEAIAFYVLGGLLHIVFLYLGGERLWLSCAGQITRESPTHALLPFDWSAVLGGMALCWSPLYLSGMPTKGLCFVRTALPPIALAMLAGGQLGRIILGRHLMALEWKKLKGHSPASSADIHLASRAARALSGVVIFSTAVVVGWTPPLLDIWSAQLPAGYVMTCAAIGAPWLVASAGYTHWLATHREATGLLEDSKSIGRTASQWGGMLAAVQSTVQLTSSSASAAAMSIVSDSLVGCGYRTALGSALLLAATLLASGGVGSRTDFVVPAMGSNPA